MKPIGLLDHRMLEEIRNVIQINFPSLFYMDLALLCFLIFFLLSVFGSIFLPFLIPLRKASSERFKEKLQYYEGLYSVHRAYRSR